MFIKMVEEVNLIGWKGKDAIEIEEGTASILIREHRKDKTTGKIVTTERTIPRVNVDVVWDLIETNFIKGEQFNLQGEKYTSRYLAKKLIQREYGTIKTKYATKRVQS